MCVLDVKKWSGSEQYHPMYIPIFFKMISGIIHDCLIVRVSSNEVGAKHPKLFLNSSNEDQIC